MIELAQVALLNDSVHVFAFVLEFHREVLFDTHRFVESGPRGDKESILRFAVSG